MCLSGAREVQQNVLSKLNGDGLRILVVWTPRYNGDDRTGAVAAANIVPDDRANHFWDASGVIPVHYGKQLDLPVDDRFAWDTYLIFGADAEWKDSPPPPVDWMHQLGILGREHPRWLDGTQFLNSVRSALKNHSSGHREIQQ